MSTLNKRLNYSVVITNYNGAKILEKNLPSVFAAVEGAEVLIVDDASSDGSLKVLEKFAKEYKNLRIIRKDKNEGFSSTTNLGVKSAKNDIVILLNSDIRPQKDFLKSIFSHFDDDMVFAVGLCDHSHEKDGSIVSRGRSVGRFLKGFPMHRLGEIKRSYSLWANGGSSVIRRGIWLTIGGLDTIYNPAYGEDLDMGYRAWKMGYTIMFEPESIVDHYHESGAMKGRYLPIYRRAITFRNQNLFVLINITDRKYLLDYFLWLPYHLGKALLRLDFAFWYGFLLVFPLLPRAISHRVRLLTKFVKTDREIFDILSKEFKEKNEEIF